VSDTIRAFIAVDASEGVQKELCQLIRPWRDYPKAIRVVKPEQLHLTLKFLGNITDTQKEEVIQVLETVAAHHKPWDLEFKGLGAFSSWARPHVVWIGVGEGSQEVKALAGDVEKQLSQKGFAKEERSFQVHLTLGRVKFPRLPQELSDTIQQSLEFKTSITPVKAIYLYRSHLSSEGPRYECLKAIPLKRSSV